MLSHTTRTRNTLGGIAANASSQMQAQLQTLASEKDSAVALALALQQRITEVTALPETEDVQVHETCAFLSRYYRDEFAAWIKWISQNFANQ